MNCILLLGNPGQIFAFNLFLIVVLIVLLIIFKIKKSRIFYKGYNYFKSMLFWSPYLMLCFRAFIPLCIATYLNQKFEISSTNGEILANVYSKILRFIVIGWFPLVMLYVICVSKRTLNNGNFNHKYGFLYQTIRQENIF